MPLTDREPARSSKLAKPSPWIGWLPVVTLPAVAVDLRNALSPWVFMWAVTCAIYFSLKWLTWWSARNGVAHTARRSIAYILLWPGMDVASFLDETPCPDKPPTKMLYWAIAKTGLGAALLWVVAREVPVTEPLLRGWVGMTGLVLLLHFGSFDIVAFIWQRLGVRAQPIMSAPLQSTSLNEFWGRRWNLGFRQLAHELVFRRLYRTIGVGAAGLFVFVLSGIIHDLVISLPARAGYGLPTAYFVLQGIGISVEKSDVGKRAGIGRGLRGRVFTMLVAAAPAYWLFHPWFVIRVILPFMQGVRAL